MDNSTSQSTKRMDANDELSESEILEFLFEMDANSCTDLNELVTETNKLEFEDMLSKACKEAGLIDGGKEDGEIDATPTHAKAVEVEIIPSDPPLSAATQFVGRDVEKEKFHIKVSHLKK